jgi:Ribbon-helix-helix protein, copG family
MPDDAPVQELGYRAPTSPSGDQQPMGYQRLSVNLNSESAEILRRVTRARQISTTEAIRRAIGLLGFFEQARQEQKTIITRDSQGEQTEILPL